MGSQFSTICLLSIVLRAFENFLHIWDRSWPEEGDTSGMCLNNVKGISKCSESEL